MAVGITTWAALAAPRGVVFGLQAVGDGIAATLVTIRDDNIQAISDVIATVDGGGGAKVGRGGEGKLGRESDDGDGKGGQLHDDLDVAVVVAVAERAKERKKAVKS